MWMLGHTGKSSLSWTIAPKCQNYNELMAKYDLQKASKIPYLECAGYQTMICLRKRRFQCSNCKKMAVAETSLIKSIITSLKN